MSNTSEKNIFTSDIKLVDLTGLEKYHEKLKSKFIVNNAVDASNGAIGIDYDGADEGESSVSFSMSDSVDGDIGASIIVNDHDNVAHSGLTINDGYTKIVGETQTGSSETSGGSIVLTPGSVNINAWAGGPDMDNHYSNNLSLNENGLLLNGSEVITSQNAYANGVLCVNSQNISNRNELTIGSFEIKNVTPYNYTIEASYLPEDPDYFYDQFSDYDECIITAEWDKNEPVIVEHNSIFNTNYYEDIYAYKFIITSARVLGVLNDDSDGTEQWYNYQKPVNTEVFIPAGYLDEEYRDIEKGIHPIEFIDGQGSLPGSIYIDSADELKDITITQYAPMSLRHTSKALLNGVEVATVDDIQNITVDTKLDINSNNPIANSAVANAIMGGVHFIGTTSQLPWEGLQNTTIGQSLDGSDTKEYNIGDIIIVAPGGNENGFDEPTKEYILAYGNEYGDDGVSYGYRWVELGDVSPAQSMIDESLKNYYKKSEVYNKSEIDTNIPIVKGNANNSAVLKGEYTVGTTKYTNNAISQVSMAIGAAATAGLKGYYYKAIDFANKKIYLSASQPNSIKTSGFSAESITCDYTVGDYISIVADSKFENCSKITAKGSGVITVESLPFTADDLPSYTLGIGKQPDDFTLYSANRSISGLTNAMSIKNYDKGTVDMGGGSLAEGVQTFATNIGAHAEGIQTHAYGQYSHTEGFRTQAGYAAHAEGRETIASGSRSHAEGQNTVASGDMSHSQGIDTIASGARSFATGNGTIAEGAQSITGGYKSKSAGDSAISIGHRTYAKGQDSICVGSGNNEVTAYESKTNEEILAGVKDGSIVASIALGKQSQSFGGNTFAYGGQSFAGGWRTKAIGNHSHAEGNYSIAEGDNSFAGGNYSEAKGAASFATGDHTKATNDYEVAFGKYNNSTANTLFSVGNGTSESARNNAFELVVSDENIPAHWDIRKWPDTIVIHVPLSDGSNSWEVGDKTVYCVSDAYLTCKTTSTIGVYSLKEVRFDFLDAYGYDLNTGADLGVVFPAFSKTYTTNESDVCYNYYDWSQTSSYCRAARSVLGLIFDCFTDVNDNKLDYNTGLSIVGNENTRLDCFEFKIRARTIDEFTDGDHVSIESFKESPFADDKSYNIFKINNTTYKYRLNTYDDSETYDNLLWSYSNAQITFVDSIEAGVNGYINGKKIATNDANDFDTSKLEAAIQTNANNIDKNADDIDKLSTEINTIKTDIDNVENSISNIPIQTHTGGVIMVNSGGANAATGGGSFAIGKSTIAAGVQSISAGYKSKTAGDSSISIGHKTYAKGQDSICIGTSNNEVTAYETKTNEEILAGVKDGSIVASIALGNQSQAFGGNVFAYGSQAHAEGWRTKAIGNHSHAEGNYSIAEGVNSHVGGNYCTANGDNSYAGGNYCTANGAASFASGDHTITTKNAEVAFGKYNVSDDDTVFSIGGGGPGDGNRKNLFEVKNANVINGTGAGVYAYVNDEIIATRTWVETNYPTGSANVEIASIDEIDALLESLNLVVENNDPSASVDSI